MSTEKQRHKYKYNTLISGLLWATVALLGASCEQLVEPEFATADPVVVVEAWVVDQPGESYIRLSRTVGFNTPGNVPPVENAAIIITDSRGNTTVFEEERPGFYLPVNQEIFAGEAGQLYTLNISVDDLFLSASSRMPIATVVDSLSVFERRDELLFEDGFYLNIHYQDPPNVNNFYYWEWLLNDNPIKERNTNLQDDLQTDGQYVNRELLGPLALNDRAEVRWFSIGPMAYSYLLGLSQLVDVGSPSQAVPENPRTNIKGGALGFFYTAALSTASVTVD